MFGSQANFGGKQQYQHGFDVQQSFDGADLMNNSQDSVAKATNPFSAQVPLDPEEETEKEAIELIQGQQEQITRLKEQLEDKNQEFINFEKTQSGQVETYKS